MYNHGGGGGGATVDPLNIYNVVLSQQWTNDSTSNGIFNIKKIYVQLSIYQVFSPPSTSRHLANVAVHVEIFLHGDHPDRLLGSLHRRDACHRSISFSKLHPSTNWLQQNGPWQCPSIKAERWRYEVDSREHVYFQK
jgi:hypothetical protein